ncbi:hypothetical protein G6F50_015805 [Rhizopus delemar]|uniref:Uncharacterized protein n=1 Tax=Rhizopus delemar TaxID=936053 RepID=A0A9P7C3M3_9FUNG|nr:hypothetical protein G6F50_015805 [Rhizopus delemar]
MAAVHHTVLHGFQHLAGLHQITGGEDLDVEAPVGDFSHIPRNVLRAREQRGRFVREAGRQPPRHGGRFLREGRRRDQHQGRQRKHQRTRAQRLVRGGHGLPGGVGGGTGGGHRHITFP